ncbi:MAG: hypothetical protein IPG33_16635 [Betaproteobacteria bacterium]|nr:hypothetical protein [Betaproteobacteria bacterium]
MSRKRVVILGSGAAARMVGGMLKADAGVELVGFTDANPARHGQALCGLPILGADEIDPPACISRTGCAARLRNHPASRRYSDGQPRDR